MNRTGVIALVAAGLVVVGVAGAAAGVAVEHAEQTAASQSSNANNNGNSNGSNNSTPAPAPAPTPTPTPSGPAGTFTMSAPATVVQGQNFTVIGKVPASMAGQAITIFQIPGNYQFTNTMTVGANGQISIILQVNQTGPIGMQFHVGNYTSNVVTVTAS